MSEEYEEPELEDALAASWRLAGAVKNAESYDELASAISQRYAGREEFDRAVEIADTINDPYTRDRNLAEIAVKADAVGEEDAAFQLLDSLEDLSHQATATSNIAIAHAAAGDFDRAIEIAETMEDRSATLAEIAVQCAGQGEGARALEIAGTLDFPLHASLVLTRVAASYIEAGRVGEGVELLSRALEEAAAIENADEKATTLSEIALQFSAAGQDEQAAVILSQALAVAENAEEIYKDLALSQIAATHSRLKQYDNAVKVAEKIDDAYQAASTLISLAVIEHEDETRQAEAMQLLSDAYDLIRDEVPETQREETQRNGLLALLAIRYADFGQTEPSRKAAATLVEPEERLQALTAVAVRYAQAEKYDEAITAARAIDEETHKADALLKVSRVMLVTDAKERGGEILSEALSLNEKLSRPADRAHILSEAAIARAEAGQKEEAAPLIKRALLETKSINGEYHKATALLSIADACEKTEYELDDEAQEILWDASAG